MIESIVTQVDVIVASATQILTSLAGVTRIVLRTSVSDLHYDTSTVASTVATTVVLASYLESAAAHCGWAGWAFTLAQVCVPAIITVASRAGRI